MCCFLTILLFFGPRLAIFFWWLYDTFGNRLGYFDLVFGGWIIPLLGFIFLPWTLLMYMIVWPGGIAWWEWIFVGLALVVDIGGYTGGYRNRNFRGSSI